MPQIYLEAPGAAVPGVQFAPRTLAAFDRVSIAAGESKVVHLTIAPRAFQYWSSQAKGWTTAQGPRTVRAGFSAEELLLEASVR